MRVTLNELRQLIRESFYTEEYLKWCDEVVKSLPLRWGKSEPDSARVTFGLGANEKMMPELMDIMLRTKPTLRPVKLDELYVTQDEVSKSHLLTLLKTFPKSDVKNRPIVVIKDGKKWLVDGHHRAMAAHIRNRQRIITANVYEDAK